MFRYAKEVNECLRSIKQGDLSKFEPLFDYTAIHLLKVARHYLKNKSLDEDVIAEAFVKVLKYVDSYDCGQDGYNWLCKIVQNTAYDVNYEEDKLAQSEKEFQSALPLIARDAFESADFFMSIDCLTETDRQIAVARFFFGKTYEEIGREHNITRSAVCQRLGKICKILKNYLKLS